MFPGKSETGNNIHKPEYFNLEHRDLAMII